MKELNLFIKALENNIPNIKFIPRYKTENTKFGGIKTATLEVYTLKNKVTELFVSSSSTARMVTEHENEIIKEQLIIKVISEILKKYGI